jgi:hypothetical protein
MLSLLHALPVCVVGAEAVVPGSFEPFQIIAERNIFAPKSSGRPAESEKPSRPTPDSLVLAGTMSYEKGQFAFFDGSNPDFRKVLKVGGNVGGCILTEITSKQVKLKAGALEFELPVGTRLLRENASQWKFGGKAEGISPAVKTVSQTPQVLGSKDSSKAVQEEGVLGADPDKYTRWVEKKVAKYLDGMDPEVRKEKNGNKFPGAFYGDGRKNSDKRHKHDEG